MRLRLVVAAIVLVGVFAYLTKTTNAPEADKAERAQLPRIESGQTAVPVVRGDEVTFYAEGDAGAPPRVVSDLTGWGERPDGTFDFSVGKMHHIAGTNWFTLSARTNPAARIEYLFAYGAGDYRVDPRNPRKVMRVGGEASEVVMPGLIVRQRRVIVYTPPGYDPSRKYRLAVFHDGGLVVNTGEARRDG